MKALLLLLYINNVELLWSPPTDELKEHLEFERRDLSLIELRESPFALLTITAGLLSSSIYLIGKMLLLPYRLWSKLLVSDLFFLMYGRIGLCYGVAEAAERL